MMIYHVKNTVEEIPEMNYNDGIRKIFLYIDGEKGGSDELKKLLSYIKQSSFENVTDRQLEKLHHGVEVIKNNSTIGVKYMQMWEIVELEKRESKEEGIAEGIAKGKTEGRIEAILELLEELGSIPENLMQTISSQQDISTLNRWHKLSAKVSTIDEFMEKMN